MVDTCNKNRGGLLSLGPPIDGNYHIEGLGLGVSGCMKTWKIILVLGDSDSGA